MANVVQGQRKKIWSPLYDSFRHATTGHNAINFFSDPYGKGTSAHEGSGAKTIADTNLRGQGGILAGGETMRVHGLRIKYKPITYAGATLVTDLQLIRYAGVFTLKVGGATMVEQQLWDIPSGVGVTGFASTTATTTSIAGASNGIPVVENMWKFYEQPIDLDDKLNIECTITWTTAATPTTATVIVVQLEGYREGLIVG